MTTGARKERDKEQQEEEDEELEKLVPGGLPAAMLRKRLPLMISTAILPVAAL